MRLLEHPLIIVIPRVGDEVYVDSLMAMGHGPGLVGGKAIISAVAQGTYAGDPTPIIMVAEHPDYWYNWHFLGRKQRMLRSRFGAKRARIDDDFHLEFNDSGVLP